MLGLSSAGFLIGAAFSLRFPLQLPAAPGNAAGSIAAALRRGPFLLLLAGTAVHYMAQGMCDVFLGLHLRKLVEQIDRELAEMKAERERLDREGRGSAPPAEINKKEAEEPEGPAKPVATAERAPAAARADEDDPGRPVLRRGAPSGQRAPAPARRSPQTDRASDARSCHRQPGAATWCSCRTARAS